MICISLISFSMMSSIIYYVCYIFFIHPLMDIRLYLYFGYYNAAMNMGVQIIFEIYPKVGLLNNKVVPFFFFRNLHTILHRGSTNLYSHQHCTQLPLSPHPHQNLSFLSDDSASKCVVISFCISLMISEI